ncbi:MAG: response regulator transcription factor [Nocardioides sp.]|uniref:response regulator transcription factor n=1 Tax=Nocardioides sp. TaxID=35761 RepID=UPI003EFC0184
MVQQLSALVVEDDPDITTVIVESLIAAGFDVTSVADGRSAVDTAAELKPDLVTLDLTLPKMDGIEVCRHIRENSDCYIVMISARSDEIDRLIGLEVGADDYLLKPFSPRELRAHVAALFRRPRNGTFGAAPPTQYEPSSFDSGSFRVPVQGNGTPSAQRTYMCGGGLVVHPARREVEVNGKTVDLTRIEYDVLEFLAARSSTVCTREAIVHAIWNSNLEHDWHLVDVHVANLRAKLRQHSDTVWVHTVRGVGYRLDVPADAPQPTWDAQTI